MLTTIIKKEILEAISSLRFLIAMLLCLVLIPLGTYVNLKEYEQRLADYQEAVRLYQQRAEGRMGYDFQAEGYRPPSVLSIFSVGLEYFLPNKAVTSREGNIRTSNEAGVNNPQSLLFGKVDLLFNVSFVISLLALIFTFNTVAGEKEEGTLRLMVSNSVPRCQILLAKLVGNYVVLLVPFLLSIMVALILLNTSGSVPLFSTKILPAFFVILGATLLFILSMFTLGMLISTLTHRSITAIVVLLFVWTVLVLSVPKISPMLAEVIYPVKSQQVVNLQKALIRQDLERELDRKRRELYDKISADFGFDPKKSGVGVGGGGVQAKVQAKYDEVKIPLEEEYRQRIGEEIRKLEEDDTNRRNIQGAIARNLSRVSPVSCYTYLMAEISGTGVLEMNSFLDNAQRFQQEVKETLYDRFVVRSYGTTGGATAVSINEGEGFDSRKAPVPQLQYRFTTLSEALQAEWVDIILLVLFNVVFFAGAYVSFLRYDVR